MIFLTVVGSWSGALWYDRREKRKVQEKWATLVSHIANEPVATNQLSRRVTIFLAAPPGDGLRSAREHFLEYVKPVLVAASLNWDVVEGRREGDVRAGLAERVRRYRRKHGETAQTSLEPTIQDALEAVRERTGVTEAFDIGGDIVIGRHTWKEYMRGLHEGWLGPLDPPPEPQPAEPSISPSIEASAADAPVEVAPTSTDDASPQSPEEPKKEEEKKAEEKPKPLVTPAYNTIAQYAESEVPRSMPAELQPSTPIPFPHLLGFRNTPRRMYRFLTRRHTADDIGRQTAAAVMAAYRPYSTVAGADEPNEQFEQQREMEQEEGDWLPANVKRDPAQPEKEREWLDKITLDARIAERMRRFQIRPEDEERANKIRQGGSDTLQMPEKPTLSDYDL